jgi:hypothetical protein
VVNDFAINTGFTNAAGDQLGILSTKVDD